MGEQRQAVNCDQCNKSFGLTYLAVHIKRIHDADAKKHKCDVCEKEFYNYTRLKNHKMRHGGAKSHLCEICMASFFNDEGLEDHKRGVHSKENTSDEGEVEFFFCTKCGKKFNTRRQFQAHTGRLHKQILCYKCNLTVGSYPALRLHKKVQPAHSCLKCWQSIMTRMTFCHLTDTSIYIYIWLGFTLRKELPSEMHVAPL